MMHTSQALYDNLKAHLVAIDKQIDAVKLDTTARMHGLPLQEDSFYRVKNADGTFILSDLLTAKANILVAMANLKVAGVNAQAAAQSSQRRR